MMCLGNGVGGFMIFRPCVRPSVRDTVCATYHSDHSNIVQLSNAKSSCANFHIHVYKCNAARGSGINQLSCPILSRMLCVEINDMKYINSCTTQWLKNGYSFFKFIDSSKLQQKSSQFFRTTTPQNRIGQVMVMLR